MTQDELKQLFTFCPIMGRFKWLKTNSTKIKIGDIAGGLDKHGYRIIKINGKPYKEHRLVWLWYNGSFPIHNLDHINGSRSDNRIGNLREATYSQNNQNICMRIDNKSGYMGVSWDNGKRKWQSQISKGGKKYHLGYYDTPEEAHAAYLKAKVELHTFNPVPR